MYVKLAKFRMGTLSPLFAFLIFFTFSSGSSLSAHMIAEDCRTVFQASTSSNLSIKPAKKGLFAKFFRRGSPEEAAAEASITLAPALADEALKKSTGGKLRSSLYAIAGLASVSAAYATYSYAAENFTTQHVMGVLYGSGGAVAVWTFWQGLLGLFDPQVTSLKGKLERLGTRFNQWVSEWVFGTTAVKHAVPLVDFPDVENKRNVIFTERQNWLREDMVWMEPLLAKLEKAVELIEKDRIDLAARLIVAQVRHIILTQRHVVTDALLDDVPSNHRLMIFLKDRGLVHFAIPLMASDVLPQSSHSNVLDTVRSAIERYLEDPSTGDDLEVSNEKLVMFVERFLFAMVDEPSGETQSTVNP